jgi:2-methylcitrate dehydratase
LASPHGEAFFVYVHNPICVWHEMLRDRHNLCFQICMDNTLQNAQIAEFALRVTYSDIGEQNIEQLKKHLLDSLASLFHASTKPAIKKVVRQLGVVGSGGRCKAPLVGETSFDRAAQLYTALIRYPDFMDNFLGKEATCHPSDNIGSLLAASQFHKTTGKDFLTAMAVAYQLECRLTEEIPVMKEGIDHTLLLAYSIVGGISRLIKLNKEQLAHALGIAGCSVSPLVVSRASYTFEWKGFASSMDALECMNIVLLAQQGMTGPIALFEGPKGFKEIFNMKLEYDWSKENFELIKKCILKRYNAEVHSQSAIEAVLEIRNNNQFSIDEIERINVTTFLTAYHIIGSGAYGDRQVVETKEQADHSLFYLIAVALLDGDIYPEQFETSRIEKSDVQELLHKVHVNTKFPIHKPVTVAGLLDPYTEAYPGKMRTKVEIVLKNGEKLTCRKDDYPGFHTRPLTWEDVIEKFYRLCSNVISRGQQQKVIDTVRQLDNYNNMEDLINLLSINKVTADYI